MPSESNKQNVCDRTKKKTKHETENVANSESVREKLSIHTHTHHRHHHHPHSHILNNHGPYQILVGKMARIAQAKKKGINRFEIDISNSKLRPLYIMDIRYTCRMAEISSAKNNIYAPVSNDVKRRKLDTSGGKLIMIFLFNE